MKTITTFLFFGSRAVEKRRIGICSLFSYDLLLTILRLLTKVGWSVNFHDYHF